MPPLKLNRDCERSIQSKGGLYKTSQSSKVRKIQFKFDHSPTKTKTLFTSFASTLISHCTQFFCVLFCFVLSLGILRNFADA